MTFNLTECRQCVQRYGDRASPTPCQTLLDISRNRNRPQVRGYRNNWDIGNFCAFSVPWPEYYKSTKPGQAWDGNEDALMYNRLIHARLDGPGLYRYPDKSRESAGHAAGYVKNVNSGNHGYKTSDGDFRAIMTVDASDPKHLKRLDELVGSNAVLDPRSTWIGAVTRFASGAGVTDGGGQESIHGHVMNLHAAMNTGFKFYPVNGSLERGKTYGGDATTSLTVILITGLKSIDKLPGTPFSGSDINLAAVISLSTIQNAGKAKKLTTIGNRIIKGAEAFEDWEKAEFIKLAWKLGTKGAARGSAASTGADVFSNSGKNVFLLNIAGSGIALSYSEWSGTLY